MAPDAAARHAIPTTASCSTALFSFGQSAGGFKPLHCAAFKEADMLAAVVLSILTRQGSAVGVGDEVANTAQVPAGEGPEAGYSSV